MIRTQLYITKQEQQLLRALINKTGKSQSELIRQALDKFIRTNAKGPKHNLEKSTGLWAERTGVPDFTAIRQEFDRFTDNTYKG